MVKEAPMWKCCDATHIQNIQVKETEMLCYVLYTVYIVYFSSKQDCVREFFQITTFSDGLSHIQVLRDFKKCKFCIHLQCNQTKSHLVRGLVGLKKCNLSAEQKLHWITYFSCESHVQVNEMSLHLWRGTRWEYSIWNCRKKGNYIKLLNIKTSWLLQS